MEKIFCEYLINIGLIDNKISNDLKLINKEVSKTRKEFSFTDSFFISLMHYFNNLTLNQKKYMCFSLPLRFILSRQKELNQKLKSILFKKNMKEKIIKLKYLLRWMKGEKFKFDIKKNLDYKDKSDDNLLLDEDSGSIVSDDFMTENKKISDKINRKDNKNNIYLIEKNKKNGIKKNISFNKSRTNNYQNIKIKDLLTTSDRKELLQLSECTFKPTINTTTNSFRKTNPNSNRKTTFMKLYQDSEKYRIKKKLKELEFEKIVNNELTFKPHLCHTPKSISNFKFDSFEERQKNFINNKKENTNKLKINIERNTAKKCSFMPKVNKLRKNFNFSSIAGNRNNLTNLNSAKTTQVYNLTNEDNKQNDNLKINTNNNSKNNNYIGESYYSLNTAKTVPAHLRLYNDSQRRNTSYIQKENEYNKLINDMANRTSKKFMRVNYDKLFDLYQNKEGKANFEKTKQKVEKEEGVTFMPDICQNNKYINRICSDFYERNKNYQKNDNFKKYEKFDEVSKKNEKKYTDEQKKRIINNIVQRLYKESLNKNNNDKNNRNECNKYNKKYSLLDSNRNIIQKKISETKIN